MPWATNRSRAKGLKAFKAQLQVLELVFERPKAEVEKAAGTGEGGEAGQAFTSFVDAESMADAYTVRLDGVQRYAVRAYVSGSRSQGSQRVFLPLIEAARKAREAADRGESPVRPELARCFVYSRSHPLFVIAVETHDGVPPGCVSCLLFVSSSRAPWQVELGLLGLLRYTHYSCTHY